MSAILEGRVAIITGASQGLGRAIALRYAQEGAALVLCARDGDLMENARAGLLAEVPGSRIVALAADVSNEADVEHLIAAAVGNFGGVDVLVNNAGIYGPLGPIESVDWRAWVQAVQTNLLGSVLTCRAVVPHMKKRGYGKIIQLSGGGATSPMPRISAYAATKAAVVRFAETLAEEVREHGIDVNAVAPGALNTRLLDEVLQAGPEAVGETFHARSLQQRESGGAGFTPGVELALWLASAQSDGITGKLLSAIWDPWPGLAQHRQALDSDVYTLRRIVPADRGLNFEPEAGHD